MDAATAPTKPKHSHLAVVCSWRQGRAPAGEKVHCTMDRYSVGLSRSWRPTGRLAACHSPGQALIGAKHTYEELERCREA